MRTIWDKRIPTVLGLLLLTFGALTTSWLVKSGVTLTSRASPTYTPEKIRITNIAESSFTVSYTTAEKTTGALSVGKDASLGQLVRDVRDGSGDTPLSIHYVTVTNLAPATTYYFAILSNGMQYLQNNEPFSITTAPHLPTQPPTQPVIKGQLTLPSGDPPTEAVMYVTNEYAQTISTLVETDGSYTLQMQLMRTNDLASYFPVTENIVLKMLALGDGLESTISLYPQQANPVPLITLSQQYNFTLGTTTSDNLQNPADIPLFPTFGSKKATTKKLTTTKRVQITLPQNNASLTTQLFQGTGIPNQYVDITIRPPSDLTARVLINSQGIWTYRPKETLQPGTHTITIQSRDTNGMVTLNRTFSIPQLSVTPTP